MKGVRSTDEPGLDPLVFEDRREAGIRLSGEIGWFMDSRRTVIVGLARGGVIVAGEIARLRNLPFTVLVVRKIGIPGDPEFAFGALAEGGIRMINTGIMDELGITRNDASAAMRREEPELMRRVNIYRGGKPFPDLEGREAVIVDDGLATGMTAYAAVAAVRRHGASKVRFVSPVCASETAQWLGKTVDSLCCLSAPSDMRAIGAYYRNFGQVSDRDVVRVLRTAIPVR